MNRSQLTRRAAGWTDEAVRGSDAAACDIAVVRRPPPVECGALVTAATPDPAPDHTGALA